MLDIAGHQSFPLVRAGYDVTILDQSRAMLDKAGQRLERLPVEVQRRVTLLRPALERRWDDVLVSFDTSTETNVLGVPGRADTVDELSALLHQRGVQALEWYGVWLFVDWLGFSGVELAPSDTPEVAATAAVELEASRRDPYRQLSRVGSARNRQPWRFVAVYDPFEVG